MKGLVISTDFDDTLFSLSEEKVGMLWTSSEVLVPIQKVHDLLFEKHNEGYIIDIVTARETWDIPEVKAYVEEYKLPIRDIHSVACKPKSPVLKEIGSVLHIDDSIMVAVECMMSGFDNVLLVDDGRHKNNTTAEKFDRIFVDRNF